MSGFFNRIRAGSGPLITSVAKTEGIEPEILWANLLDRSAVLMIRGDREGAIGRNLRTKVNANIGTSPGEINPGKEIEKARIAESAGASVAVGAGADYLCYITPAEHLALPTPGDVREGIIVCRIAAHIGDTVKMQQAMNRDRALAEILRRQDRALCAEISVPSR